MGQRKVALAWVTRSHNFIQQLPIHIVVPQLIVWCLLPCLNEIGAVISSQILVCSVSNAINRIFVLCKLCMLDTGQERQYVLFEFGTQVIVATGVFRLSYISPRIMINTYINNLSVTQITLIPMSHTIVTAAIIDSFNNLIHPPAICRRQA